MPIQAIVRNGQLELDSPIDLPDGTVLTIPVPENAEQPGLEEQNSPEAIERWMRWYDSLEPLMFTDEERAAWEAARREDKEFELSHWESRSKRLENLFP